METSRRISPSSSLDTDLNLGTDLQFGDFSASIAGSFLKKGDTFYVDITKFPDLFFDITPIKNQWIAFTVNDLNNLGASTLSFDPSQAQNIEQQQQDSLAQGKLLYALAQQNGVRVATTVPNDSTHPNLRGFSISLVRDKVADFYQQAETQLHADYPTDAQFVFDQTVYDYLNSQDFTNLFNYLSQNTSLTLWLDPKTGFPAEFDSTFRLIPPDSATKLAKTEFLLSTTVNLMNVNQPINIVAPNPTVSLDDAEFLMSGEPKDVYLYNKQIANIQSLRYALQSYNTYAGSYPSDLSGLVITYGDAAKLNSNQAGTTVSTFEAPMKILNSIPNDAYTSQPYIYSAANGEYSLTYGITKPTSTSTPNPFAAGYGIKVANGTNTATSKHFSVQGDAGK